MHKLFNSLLDLIFPPRCEACGKSGPEALCPECFAGVRFMKPQYGIHCAAAYDGAVRTALHRFKFQKRKRLAEPLGILLVNYLGQAPALKMKEFDSIVPVPLHRKRLRQRGFNQIDLLASVIGRYYELPVVPSLERVKNTRPQFDLPKHERFENIKGAFRVCRSKEVYDKRLLLLDDIYTTGATAAECVRALTIAGARRVEVLTLARAA
ncbi:MAG: ComF family protein [Candidatus Saganbacteria bacterium]|nr:ComF family protein [Candidatus Saganbacteria bacterium]